MKSNVVIKYFPNGISVYLDMDAPFEDILDEIKNKFIEAEKFFQDSKMAISFEGRALTEKQERKILDVISQNTNVHIICVVGKDDAKNQIYLKAVKQTERKDDSNNTLYYKGNLKDEEILESEKSIVIVGDVYPGCTVASNKDIIILGGLYGEAYAGCDGEEGHFIIALEMTPEKLKIGENKLKTIKESKWPIKPKIQPKIALVHKDKLVLEVITKDVLNLMS